MIRRSVPLLALLTALALPSLAHANAYSRVLSVFLQKHTVPPCRFKPATLSAALAEEDTYDQEYFLDFTNAVQQALSNRAATNCPSARSRATAALGASALGANALSSILPRGFGHFAAPPRSEKPPRSVTATSSSGLPAPVAILGAITALAVLLAAISALVLARGWDPYWLAGWRHACAEAGYRLGTQRVSLGDRRLDRRARRRVV